VGPVFECVWRLCWKVYVVCILLSPFVSFQSRFVTYLLKFPCIWNFKALLDVKYFVLSIRHFLYVVSARQYLQHQSCQMKKTGKMPPWAGHGEKQTMVDAFQCV
jgi:hypothetical protein